MNGPSAAETMINARSIHFVRTEMYLSLIGLALAFIFCFILVPSARKLGFKVKIIDLPSYRKVHKDPVPCTGGIAIYMAFFSTLLLFGLFSPLFQIMGTKAAGLFGCSTALLLLGLYDDKKNLKPLWKLSGQIIIVTITFILGFRIDVLSHPLLGGSIALHWLAWPVTLFWFLGFINVINLIDGLDGLASGIVSITSFILLLLGVFSGDVIISILAGILSGAALAFLYFSFRQEKIFLGDNGSMFLGFLIAVLPIMGMTGRKGDTLTPFVVTFLCIGVPIYDTASAIIRRLKNKRSILEADQAHIHHRLLAKGLSPRQVVVILNAITFLLGMGALVFTIIAAIPARFSFPCFLF